MINLKIWDQKEGVENSFKKKYCNTTRCQNKY